MKELLHKFLLVLFFLGFFIILYKTIFVFINSYIWNFGVSVVVLLFITILSLIATQWFQGLRVSGNQKLLIVIVLILFSRT